MLLGSLSENAIFKTHEWQCNGLIGIKYTDSEAIADDEGIVNRK